VQCRICREPVTIAETDDQLIVQLQWYECLCRAHAQTLVQRKPSSVMAETVGMSAKGAEQLERIDR
jgi:hypothetical protein